ncbi:MAG: SufE family protein [Oceanicola sp.]|jgi:cysteine desulfuration protein SufE|nr:SufE family protein [Oceanicola sp.]
MPSDAFEEIVDTFAFLDDWEDRYRHVIDLGKAMPALDEAERVPATKVEGCASQVWLVPEVTGQGPSAIIQFRGESDAMIVKGLIAILIALCSGQTAQALQNMDVKAELGRLDLAEHLSSQRSNGLNAMIERVKALSAHAVSH